MKLLHCRLLQRAVAAVVSVALVASGLAGCATKPTGYAWIEGIVVDGQRLAAPGDGGLLSVTRDGRIVEGRAGMELRRGDRVTTGPRAEAVIRYASGSELLMRPNSSGVIGSFLQAVNEVFARIKGRFEVETAFVRAGAKGTSFLVRTMPGGETTVIVFDGTVIVDSTQGAWAPVTIGAGQKVIAHPRPPQPTLASEAELQATREWVERLERLVPQATTASSTEAAVAAAAVAIAVGAIIASRSRSRDSAPAPATPPSGTERTGTADGPAAGRAGTDRQKAQDAAPPPLGMPTRLTPGQPKPPTPLQNCSNGVTLTWSAVAGARSYVVQFESSDKPGQWRAGPPTATASPQTAMSASQLRSSNRWSVQAREGNRSSPASPWVYFNCNFGPVVR